MKTRILTIFFILLMCWMVLMGRAFFLQVLPNQRLSQLQKQQFEKIITLKPRRGAIVDRNEKELAVSIPSFSLFADPKLIENPRRVANRLSLFLKTPFQPLHKKLIQSEKRFMWIRRQLDKEQMVKINAWKEKGLGFIEEPKRIYPSNQVLAHTMGFVGRDGEGLEGIELIQDRALRGANTEVHFQRDAYGRPLLINGKMFTNSIDGSTIRLTIDSNIQYYLEKELEYAIEKHDADSAVGVVIDVESSEVLALANVPVFNPNHPLIYSSKVRRNRIVTDAFEPGSTLKTFVVATGLKHKVAKPNDKYFCENGKFNVADKVIKDAEHEYGWLSVSEILAYSSNIGAAKLAFDIGAKTLRSELLNFGFGAKTGIELPGESSGILNKLPWNKHLLSNVSFGHGISATPLQVAMAYNVIANGGTLYKPIIVKSITNDSSGETEEFKAQPVRQVLTKDQAETLRLMLMSATAPGSTGFNARVHGYPVGGKTGTAQKVDLSKGGYADDAYNSSFVGFVPVNTPKFVILISLDQPRNEYYGSQVAAPVFAKVAGYLMRKTGTDPILLTDKDLLEQKSEVAPTITPPKAIEAFSNFSQTPNFIGMSLRQVLRSIHNTPLEVKVKGSGLVKTTTPLPGEPLPFNKKVSLILEPVE